jgi:hypothetical protein
MLKSKISAENAALSRCREFCSGRRISLYVETISTEFQFDRKKLTIYLKRSGEISVCKLVRKLYDAFKMRISVEEVSAIEPMKEMIGKYLDLAQLDLSVMEVLNYQPMVSSYVPAPLPSVPVPHMAPLLVPHIKQNYWSPSSSVSSFSSSSSSVSSNAQRVHSQQPNRFTKLHHHQPELLIALHDYMPNSSDHIAIDNMYRSHHQTRQQQHHHHPQQHLRPPAGVSEGIHGDPHFTYSRGSSAVSSNRYDHTDPYYLSRGGTTPPSRGLDQHYPSHPYAPEYRPAPSRFTDELLGYSSSLENSSLDPSPPLPQRHSLFPLPHSSLGDLCHAQRHYPLHHPHPHQPYDSDSYGGGNLPMQERLTAQNLAHPYYTEAEHFYPSVSNGRVSYPRQDPLSNTRWASPPSLFGPSLDSDQFSSTSSSSTPASSSFMAPQSSRFF